MTDARTPIAERDRHAAVSCCEYALRNLSPTAARDIDLHAMANCFADHGAAVLAAADREREAGGRQHGLSVEIIGGRLVIAIGVDALMTAVRGGDFWDDEELTIVSADVLAADILHELERELDDGTTPVHLMIDAAAEEAIDQGSLGVGNAAGEV